MLLDVDHICCHVVQALLGDEFTHVVVSVDLVDLTVFVAEVALASMRTHFGCKERFAVLIAPASNFFGLESCRVRNEFVIGVSELA